MDRRVRSIFLGLAVILMAASLPAQTVTVGSTALGDDYDELADAMADFSTRATGARAGTPDDNVIILTANANGRTFGNTANLDGDWWRFTEGLTIRITPGTSCTIAMENPGNNHGIRMDERSWGFEEHGINYGLVIDGTGGNLFMTNPTPDDQNVVFLQGADNVKFRRVTFLGFTSSATNRLIQITNRGSTGDVNRESSNNLVFEDCVFDGLGRLNDHCINFAGTALADHDATFTGCEIKNAGNHGLRVGRPSRLTFNDCTFTGNAAQGINVVTAADDVNVRDVQLNRCTLSNNGNNGMSMIGGLPSTQTVTLNACSIYGNPGMGINLGGSGEAEKTLSLVNCYVYNNGVGETAQLNIVAGLTAAPVVATRKVNINFCTIVDSTTTGSVSNTTTNTLVGAVMTTSTLGAGNTIEIRVVNSIIDGRVGLNLLGDATTILAQDYNVRGADDESRTAVGANSATTQPIYRAGSAPGDLSFLNAATTPDDLHYRSELSPGVDLVPESQRLGSVPLTDRDFDDQLRPMSADSPANSDAGADEMPQALSARPYLWQLLE